MNTSSVEIRDAQTADIQTVIQLLQPYVESQLLLPRTEAEIEKLIQHGFVAELRHDHPRIVAFAAVEVYSRKLAEIQCLAVATDHQRLGIGRQLIQACVRRAESLGVVELMAITASEKLFNDCGFDFSLPNQKKALFYRPASEAGDSRAGESR